MMRYVLKKIHELCGDIGLASILRSPEELAIELADGVVLHFRNPNKEEDCLAQFEGTPWHTHGDFIFVDSHGHEIEMSCLNVVSGLAEGQILVCEKWKRGELVDRWLDHQDYVGPFHLSEEGDEVRIWRVSRQIPSSSS